jgi:hypothetical protein
MFHVAAIRRKAAAAQPVRAMDPIVVRSNAMIIRNSLLVLALATVAGSAFAAAPAGAPASGKDTTKQAHKEKRVCEERSKMGHCEKWATAKGETAVKAAKPEAAKPAKP